MADQYQSAVAPTSASTSILQRPLHEDETPSKSLYISHFISTWSSRGFEFGAVLFLAAIYPGTLLPMSIYALLRSAAAIGFSAAIGNFIDTKNRLEVIRISIIGQRLAVLFSCCCLLSYLLLWVDPRSIFGTLTFVILIVLSCMEKLCSIMNTVAVERDWVVVIADGDEHRLQTINSQMRRIDLFCKLVSPLAIALLDGMSTTLAVLSTLCFNAIIPVPEYFLIAWVYRRTPRLANSKKQSSTQATEQTTDQQTHSSRFHFGALIATMTTYSRSPAFLPSLSLSVLYLTVLSFSGQMVTYLLALDSPKLSSSHVGLIRAVSTVLEISSTFLAPYLINRLGAVRAGIWCLSWQFLCLTPGVSSFWLPINSTLASTTVLISSVILSRLGLWSFDLTAQILVQNSVDASQRGSFSTMEASIQNFFELCAFSMTIVWSRPDQFRFPATVSLAAVYVAAVLYAHFVRARRGHLLHLPDCCKVMSSYEALKMLEDDARELEELDSAGRS